MAVDFGDVNAVRTAQSKKLAITPMALDANKKDRRWRGMFRFWLDANNPLERCIGEELSQLKAKRKFTSTIRDALRLFFDLKAGRTEVLKELFPGVVAALTPPPAQASEQFEELLRYIAQHIDRVGQTPASSPALNIINLPFPDDEFDTVKVEVNTSVDSGKTFLDSLFSI